MVNIWYTTEEGKKLDFPYYDDEMLKKDLEDDYWDTECIEMTFDSELEDIQWSLTCEFDVWASEQSYVAINEIAKKLDAFGTNDFRVLAVLCDWFKFDVAVDMVTKQNFRKG